VGLGCFRGRNELALSHSTAIPVLELEFAELIEAASRRRFTKFSSLRSSRLCGKPPLIQTAETRKPQRGPSSMSNLHSEGNEGNEGTQDPPPHVGAYKR